MKEIPKITKHNKKPFSCLKAVCIIGFLIFNIFCCEKKSEDKHKAIREDSIPDNAVKVMPENDIFPPVLYSDEWSEPLPMSDKINTTGAEDSPFIAPDGNTFYFFFTPDVSVPPEKQLTDGVTGIWWSNNVSGTWSEPERIILNSDVSLDGAVFVQGDIMWFASIRSSNYGEVDIYTTKYRDGKWTDVENAGEQLNRDYDIGELHITPDGKVMYFGRGNGQKDIWMIEKIEGGWSEPVKVSNINSDLNEDQPFITSDGNELWFTGQSRLGYPGPAVFRSIKVENGNWDEPEEIISNFAGEPTLDYNKNIYFVHHFYSKEMQMIEADIYVAYRK